MHVSPTDITELIVDSASRVITELPQGKRVTFGAQSELFGGDSPLDSLLLVSLVVDIENQLQKKYSVKVTLTDERALLQPVNPFKTVTTLTRYIESLLSEK